MPLSNSLSCIRRWFDLQAKRRGWVPIVLALTVSGVQAETLVVLGDETYPPVIHTVNGKPAGVLPSVLERAQALTGDVYTVRLMPWKRAYELAVRGEGGLVGVSFTQERTQLFDYSRPVYDDDIQIVVRRGKEFAFNGLSDLKGKTVGGVLGASYGEEVDRAIEQGLFKVDRDVGQVSRLRKLLAGRLDAALVGNGNAGLQAVISGHPELTARRSELVVLPRPLTRDPLHLAFAKSMGHQAAITRFNAALEQLQKSGELKKLTEQASRTAKP